MTYRYELKNEAIRLEKVNDDNFIDLMDLEVAESQKDYVASNTVSMAQAYATVASGRFVDAQNGQPVASSNMFMMQATSAETNVASISAYLGLPTKVLTTFVKDSPIADFIKRDLRSRGMDYEGKEVEQKQEMSAPTYTADTIGTLDWKGIIEARKY